MKLSVVTPAYNEAENLTPTVLTLYEKLSQAQIPHEILIVNDNSKDNTIEVLNNLMQTVPTLRYITNAPPHNGFGFAVRKGLENFKNWGAFRFCTSRNSCFNKCNISRKIDKYICYFHL